MKKMLLLRDDATNRGSNTKSPAPTPPSTSLPGSQHSSRSPVLLSSFPSRSHSPHSTPYNLQIYTHQPDMPVPHQQQVPPRMMKDQPVMLAVPSAVPPVLPPGVTVGQPIFANGVTGRRTQHSAYLDAGLLSLMSRDSRLLHGERDSTASCESTFSHIPSIAPSSSPVNQHRPVADQLVSPQLYLTADRQFDAAKRVKITEDVEHRFRSGGLYPARQKSPISQPSVFRSHESLLSQAGLRSDNNDDTEDNNGCITSARDFRFNVNAKSNLRDVDVVRSGSRGGDDSISHSRGYDNDRSISAGGDEARSSSRFSDNTRSSSCFDDDIRSNSHYGGSAEMLYYSAGLEDGRRSSHGGDETRNCSIDDNDLQCHQSLTPDSGHYSSAVKEPGSKSGSSRLSDPFKLPMQRTKGRPAKTSTSSDGSPGTRSIIRCSICAKLFNNSSALAKHKLTHSDERKYTCAVCSKAFKRQDHLNGHMMTHSAKKPFECKFLGCSKSYCDARSLRRHLENHHQEALSRSLSDDQSSGFVSSSGSNSGGGAEPGNDSNYFKFDKCYQSPVLVDDSCGKDVQKLQYLRQMSPISPAAGEDKRVRDVALEQDVMSLTGRVDGGRAGEEATIRQIWTSGYNPLDEPKPVKCHICDRGFKNIPALNGHMRLHGGYTRKDSDDQSQSSDQIQQTPMNEENLPSSNDRSSNEKSRVQRSNSDASASGIRSATHAPADPNSSSVFITPSSSDFIPDLFYRSVSDPVSQSLVTPPFGFLALRSSSIDSPAVMPASLRGAWKENVSRDDRSTPGTAHLTAHDPRDSHASNDFLSIVSHSGSIIRPSSGNHSLALPKKPNDFLSKGLTGRHSADAVASPTWYTYANPGSTRFDERDSPSSDRWQLSVSDRIAKRETKMLEESFETSESLKKLQEAEARVLFQGTSLGKKFRLNEGEIVNNIEHNQHMSLSGSNYGTISSVRKRHRLDAQSSIDADSFLGETSKQRDRSTNEAVKNRSLVKKTHRNGKISSTGPQSSYEQDISSDEKGIFTSRNSKVNVQTDNADIVASQDLPNYGSLLPPMNVMLQNQATQSTVERLRKISPQPKEVLISSLDVKEDCITSQKMMNEKQSVEDCKMTVFRVVKSEPSDVNAEQTASYLLSNKKQKLDLFVAQSPPGTLNQPESAVEKCSVLKRPCSNEGKVINVHENHYLNDNYISAINQSQNIDLYKPLVNKSEDNFPEANIMNHLEMPMLEIVPTLLSAGQNDIPLDQEGGGILNASAPSVGGASLYQRRLMKQGMTSGMQTTVVATKGVEVCPIVNESTHGIDTLPQAAGVTFNSVEGQSLLPNQDVVLASIANTGFEYHENCGVGPDAYPFSNQCCTQTVYPNSLQSSMEVKENLSQTTQLSNPPTPRIVSLAGQFEYRSNPATPSYTVNRQPSCNNQSMSYPVFGSHHLAPNGHHGNYQHQCCTTVQIPPNTPTYLANYPATAMVMCGRTGNASMNKHASHSCACRVRGSQSSVVNQCCSSQTVYNTRCTSFQVTEPGPDGGFVIPASPCDPYQSYTVIHSPFTPCNGYVHQCTPHTPYTPCIRRQYSPKNGVCFFQFPPQVGSSEMGSCDASAYTPVHPVTPLYHTPIPSPFLSSFQQGCQLQQLQQQQQLVETFKKQQQEQLQDDLMEVIERDLEDERQRKLVEKEIDDRLSILKMKDMEKEKEKCGAVTNHLDQKQEPLKELPSVEDTEFDLLEISVIRETRKRKCVEEMPACELKKEVVTSETKKENEFQAEPEMKIRRNATLPNIRVERCDDSDDNQLSSKVQEVETVFRNPRSPIKPIKKTKHRPEPLFIPPNVNQFIFQSRLRSPRLREGSTLLTGLVIKGTFSPPPYTPPPMLSPARSGSGLFWTVHGGYRGPVTAYEHLPSATSRRINSNRGDGLILDSSLSEPLLRKSVLPPETDVHPHVNIGSSYQAEIPLLAEDRSGLLIREEPSVLLWHPDTAVRAGEEQVLNYLEYSCCAAVPGNGSNKEYALHILHCCRGDVKKAMLMLMQKEPKMPPACSLNTYTYQDCKAWTSVEIELYHRAITRMDKDFFQIARLVGGKKSVKDCVHFYYMWKHVCINDYKRLRLLRRKREQDELYNLRSQALFESTVFDHEPLTKGMLPIGDSHSHDCSVGVITCEAQ